MAVPLASEMILRSRRKAQDTDANDPGATDAVYLQSINRIMLGWFEKVERRTQPLTGTASGFTISPAGAFSVVGTSTDLIEVLQAGVSTGAGDSIYTSPLLERVRIEEILPLIAADSGQALFFAQPERYALERVQSDAEADIGKWRLLVHPIVDVQYWFPTLVRKWPAVLVATDRPDVTEEAAYMISDMAAAEVAAMFGEDQEAISNILRGVPEDIQRLLSLSVETVNRPRPRPMERAA